MLHTPGVMLPPLLQPSDAERQKFFKVSFMVILYSKRTRALTYFFPEDADRVASEQQRAQLDRLWRVLRLMVSVVPSASECPLVLEIYRHQVCMCSLYRKSSLSGGSCVCVCVCARA